MLHLIQYWIKHVLNGFDSTLNKQISQHVFKQLKSCWYLFNIEEQLFSKWFKHFGVCSILSKHFSQTCLALISTPHSHACQLYVIFSNFQGLRGRWSNPSEINVIGAWGSKIFGNPQNLTSPYSDHFDPWRSKTIGIPRNFDRDNGNLKHSTYSSS